MDEVGVVRSPAQRSGFKRGVARRLASVLPTMFYIIQYTRTRKRIRSHVSRNVQFERFLSLTEGPCLQIAVKDEYARKFGENWISVDKFDHSQYIDRHDDIQALDFPDDTFNAIVCWSVLEHVPNPSAAIGEMRRVLKPGGAIWVQLPFLFPYHADPHDYWRVSPSGLRIWMQDFEEICCGCDFWAGTSIVAATFYSGKKHQDAPHTACDVG